MYILMYLFNIFLCYADLKPWKTVTQLNITLLIGIQNSQAKCVHVYIICNL